MAGIAGSRQPPGPIFIVGAPRSGTSILTWCLGQHPKILPLEEAPGRGPFAIAVGVHHLVDSARGERSQLSALGIGRDEFDQAVGDALNSLILRHRSHLEALGRAAGRRDPRQVNARFAVARDAGDPKSRWVDGTPESTMYVCGLRRLFPTAKFVHIVRDVREVAASMLGFRLDDGSPLVDGAEQACAYWLQATQACLLAQRALGSETVHRLCHADLVERPEAALREALEFLGEEYSPACLEPLAERINSSGDVDAVPLDPAASPTIREALALSARLREGGIAVQPVAAARALFEDEFDRQVREARDLRAEHRQALETIAAFECGDDPANGATARRVRYPRLITTTSRLRFALNVCGVLLLVQLAAAAVAVIVLAVPGGQSPGPAALAWLAVAVVSAAVYAGLRRAGLRRALLVLRGHFHVSAMKSARE